MKTVVLKGGTYLFLHVPDGYLGHRMIADTEGNIRIKTSDRVGDCVYSNPLPPGQYTIVGKGNQINEEQWKGITYGEKTFGWESFGQIPVGNYQWYARAKQSGEAWIRSHGMKPEITLILKQLK